MQALLALASLCTYAGASSVILTSVPQSSHESNTQPEEQHKPSPGARRKRKNNPPPPIPTSTSLSKQLEDKETLIWAGFNGEKGSPLQRTLSQVNPNALSSSDDDVFQTRGLRMAFYNRLDSTRTDAEMDYVMNRLMPATATVLARSVKVRQPSGLLDLAGEIDYYGEEIPGDPAGIDADIVIKVHSLPINHEECEGTEALAWHEREERVTGRPIFGTIQFCRMDENDMESDVSTAVHEIFHALGFNPSVYRNFLGYENGEDDVVGVKRDTGHAFIKTPNVLATVREHFNCATMEGAELENFGGSGTAGGHWEESLYAGEMMDPVGGERHSHHDRHVLTDLTLAMMQDSGWYDVKYGSAGFNSYGYSAGCEFATGTFREALQAPDASRYLCDPTSVPASQYRFACLHDRSGVGVCYGSSTSDDFNITAPFYDDGSLDCMAADRDPGLRCFNSEGVTSASTDLADLVQCAAMECSTSGDVLINGSPCNSDTMDCPDSGYMCNDPGVLLCVGDLNDCSGAGDCYKGSCYCHGGWGGADCSVPTCLTSVGCEDGSECPESGFCGVPECGTWSCGAANRGVPCNGATGPTPTTPTCTDSSTTTTFRSAAGQPAAGSLVATVALGVCLLLLAGHGV